MASGTYRGQNASSTTWSNPSNALTANTIGATLSAALSGSLNISNFLYGTPVAGTANPPYGAHISSIAVNITTKTSSASGSQFLTVALTTNGTTNYTATQNTTALSTGYSVRTVTFTEDASGRGLTRNNALLTSFGVLLGKGNNTSNVDVDYVEIVITWTVTNYLIGARSKFPSFSDNIPLVTNAPIGAVTDDYRITSESVNWLGDSLYKIENHLITLSGSGGTTPINGGGIKLYMFTVTVTGTVSASGVIVYEEAYDKNLLSNVTTYGLTNTNLTNVKRSQIPFGEGMYRCLLVSGIGWVVGNPNIPVHVTSKAFHFFNSTDRRSWSLGFNAVGQNINTTKTFPTNDGYLGSLAVPAPVPTGTLVVKLLCIAQGIEDPLGINE